MPALPTIVLLDQNFEGDETAPLIVESPPGFNEALGRGDSVIYTLRVTRPSGSPNVALAHKHGNDDQYFPGSAPIWSSTSVSTAPFDKSGDTGTAHLGRFARAELTFTGTGAFAGHVLLIACPRTS